MLKFFVRAPHVHRVGVETPTVFAERIQRIGRVISATEQALFLGRDSQEDDRAVGAWTASEGPRLLDQLAMPVALSTAPL